MSESEPMVCERCGRPHERCRGHNRAELPCGRWPMKGQRVCGMHGGKSPGAVEKAQQRQVEAKAQAAIDKLWVGLANATPVKDPVELLARIAGSLEHMADQVGTKVNELRGVGGGEHLTQLRAEVVLLEKLLGHLRAVAKDMAQLGIDEKAVRVDQQIADLMVAAFMASLGVLELLPADRSRAIEVYLEHLGSAIGAPPETPDPPATPDTEEA